MAYQASKVIILLMYLISFTVNDMVHIMKTVMTETDTVLSSFCLYLSSCSIIRIEEFIALRANLNIRSEPVTGIFISTTVTACILLPYQTPLCIITILLSAPLLRFSHYRYLRPQSS